MTEENHSRPLAFNAKFVEARLVENARNFVATGNVTNLSNHPLLLGCDVPGVLPPWKSTILCDGIIEQAERVSIVNVPDPTNLGGLPLSGWDWFGNRMPEFPRTTPLYISPKDTVGRVRLNPWEFSNHPAPLGDFVDYEIQLNLWWAPAKTDCGIHNAHSFLEIHTQIHGQGRIQVFTDQTGSKMYRELFVVPGDTHERLVHVAGATTYLYPWHRGWTDEDCIWMAIELHPRSV